MSGNARIDAISRAAHGRRLWVCVRRHWLFLLVVAAGIALRCVVQLTYQPAILFFDSYSYLENAVDPSADSNRPLGYSVLFLRPLLWMGNLALIPMVQHLLGAGMAVAIYALLLHRGLRAWLAALAAAPVLLDAYQLQIEQNVMSDTCFQALIVGALVLLTWRPRPRLPSVAVAGLLLGVSVSLRSLGLPVLAVALVYLLVVERPARRRVAGCAALVATGVVPLLVYSGWVYQQTGIFRPGTGELSGQAPYIRTAPLANCRELATGGAAGYIVDMCPSAPIDERSQDPGDYQFPWRHGPAWTADYPPGVDPFAARREFGLRVTLNQPLDVAGAMLHDFGRSFAWRRGSQPGEFDLDKWYFRTEVRAYKGEHKPWRAVARYGGPSASVDERTAAFLRSYQMVIYTRGPVFAAGIILPVLAATGVGGARRLGLAAPALLIAAAATTLLLVSAAVAFSWRYQLPAIPLYPLAAAFGLAGMWPAGRQQR